MSGNEEKKVENKENSTFHPIMDMPKISKFPENVTKWKCDRLRKALSKLGFHTEGLKANLIERLQTAMACMKLQAKFPPAK